MELTGDTIGIIGLGSLLYSIFWLVMVIDAFRREEWVWFVFLLIAWPVTAFLYYFQIYRDGGGGLNQGFELPGAHDRRRIKELQAQIHHLDKAHHYSQLADIYFQQGKLDKAEVNYKLAMERDAADPDTRAHYGQCLLRLKRPNDALPLLDAVCREVPKHDYGHTRMALAETLAALGRRDEAIQTFEQVLQANGYARAKVQVAELYLQANRLEEARGMVREVIEDDAHAPGFQRKRDRVWVRRAKKMRGKV